MAGNVSPSQQGADLHVALMLMTLAFGIVHLIDMGLDWR